MQLSLDPNVTHTIDKAVNGVGPHNKGSSAEAMPPEARVQTRKLRRSPEAWTLTGSLSLEPK